MQIGSMVVWIWNEANFHCKNDISSRIYQTFPSEKHYHFIWVYLFWKWQRNQYENNVVIIVWPIFLSFHCGSGCFNYTLNSCLRVDCSLLACCTAWYTDIVNPCDFSEFWKESCFFHLSWYLGQMKLKTWALISLIYRIVLNHIAIWNLYPAN